MRRKLGALSRKYVGLEKRYGVSQASEFLGGVDGGIPSGARSAPRYARARAANRTLCNPLLVPETQRCRVLYHPGSIWHAFLKIRSIRNPFFSEHG